MPKMSKEDWIAKVEWEGGIIEAFQYGLSHKDLKKSDDPKFYDYVKEAHKSWLKLENQISFIMN